jgi:hypothetical protein
VLEASCAFNSSRGGKNAMTSSMYITMADQLNADATEGSRCALARSRRFVLLRHDLEGFMKNPPGPGNGP